MKNIQLKVKLLCCIILLSLPTHAQIISTYVASDTTHGFSGDGGPATAAHLYRPFNTRMDRLGNLYIVDEQNFRIRKVDTHGIISTVAGTGTQGYSGDGGQATNARISTEDLAVDDSGNIYLLETAFYVIRKINSSGVIKTIAGTGSYGFSGDGGPATAAEFAEPIGIAIDRIGNIYICDLENYRIRKIHTSGIINTVVGAGTRGFSGDGGPATNATMSLSYGIAADCHGNIFFADYGNDCIRKIDASGIISTIAGRPGYSGFSGDGGLATNALLHDAQYPCVDINGNVYFADVSNHRIRQINTSGIINTVAGYRSYGYCGDGGTATDACFKAIPSVSTDGYNLYISDANNNNVRKVTYPAYQIGSITGYSAVCVGSAITLSDTSVGGFWSTWRTGLDAVSVSGIVTGIAAGTDSIYYHVLDACMDTLTASHFITISPLPDAGTISGPTTICVETPATFRAGAAGTWALTDSTVALVGPTTGLVTSSHMGVDTVLFMVTNICGTDTTRYPIQILGVPTAGSITGADSLCPGDTLQLTDAVTGGLWRTSNSLVASAIGLGKFRGISAGSDTVIYAVSNACGTDTAKKTIVVKSPDKCRVGVAGLTSGNDIFNIFPNPNDGDFTVSVPGANSSTTSTTITNCLGQVVAQLSFAAGEAIHVHSPLQPGIYVLAAQAENKVYRAVFTVK